MASSSSTWIPEAASMKDWYADAEADLRRYVPDIDSYKPIWTHSILEGCNWKVAVENYNECYHCRFVHPGLYQRSHRRRQRQYLAARLYLAPSGRSRGGREGQLCLRRRCPINVIFLVAQHVDPGLSRPGGEHLLVGAHGDRRDPRLPGLAKSRAVMPIKITMEIAEIDRDTTFSRRPAGGAIGATRACRAEAMTGGHWC